MIARIRSGDLAPYSEGGYVLRVLSTPGRATYLGQLRRPSSMWPFPTDAPVSTIREHIGSIAVFRLAAS
jgi:hypothetical protein